MEKSLKQLKLDAQLAKTELQIAKLEAKIQKLQEQANVANAKDA